MNTSTKQWLLDLIEYQMNRVLDVLDALGMRDDAQRWPYLHRVDEALKLVEQGPDEPTP